MKEPTEDWVLVARIARPQGRDGEVICDLYTDFPENFEHRKRLWLRHNNAEPHPETLERHWLPSGKSAGRVVLKFESSNSISDAEALAGRDVLIPQSERQVLEEDTFYVSDLQGCTLVNVAGGDGPDEIGTITDVHFPTDSLGRKHAKAPPILIVTRSNGDEIMVPLAKEFLQNPDLANHRIEMRLPNGMVEANG